MTHAHGGTSRPHIPVFTVGDHLRRAREDAGWNQEELAHAIDISKNTVSSYETGRVKPRRIVLKQWALATGVPLEWLLSGEAPAVPKKPDNDGQTHPDNPERTVTYLAQFLNLRADKCIETSLSPVSRNAA